MRAELRHTERVALRLIAEAQLAQEPPPSIREMSAAAWVSSTNAVAEAVDRLIRRGLVARGGRGLSRTLRLTVDPETALTRAGVRRGPPPAPVRLSSGDYFPVARCSRCDRDHAHGSCDKEKKPCELQSST